MKLEGCIRGHVSICYKWSKENQEYIRHSSKTNLKEGRSLEARKRIDKETWNKKQKKSDLCTSPLESTKVLSDKYTQADSSQISLVQVDLEQIKYTIKSTFLGQIEKQFNR